jgi:hypothetical protein
MLPAEVPQELIDMLDEDAGLLHSVNGRVITSLARILTRYDEIKART